MSGGRHIPKSRSAETYLYAAGVGIIGGLVGTAFQLGSRGLQHLLIGPGSLLEAARAMPWYLALLVPLGGAGVAALLDYGLTRRRSSQGFGDVMEAVSLRRAQGLSVRATLSRAASSMALIATGGSVGREGPISYLSASLGARFARLSKVPGARMGLFAGCGIAAGMSASYFAPFGAVLFAMEVVLGNFSVEILAPVVVSSLMSTFVLKALASDALLGNLITSPPIYDLPQFTTHHAGEFLLYLVLGIAAAGGAWLFLTVMRESRKWIDAIPIHARLKLPLGGLAVGAIGIWLPHVWGNGYHAVNLVLTGTPLLSLVALLFVMKIIATSITLGAGGSGGIFTPTMFVGAALGLLVGAAGHALLPDIVSNPRHYAVVGMAAVLAATTQAPIMAIILLFEMTMETGLILPLLLASITASVVARWFGMQSVYAASLSARGVRVPEGIEETALTTTRVTDIMRDRATPLREHAQFDEIVAAVQRVRHNAIYVVNADKRLLGAIHLHDIKNHLADESLGAIVIAADLMSPCSPCHPDDTLAEIVDIFDDPEIHELPVVEQSTGKLLATLDRRDLISALAVEVLHTGGLRAKFVEHAGAQHYVELPRGHGIASIQTPEALAGKMLKETDFRARTGLTVLTVIRGEIRLPAVPDQPLAAGDVLIVIGPRETIEKYG